MLSLPFSTVLLRRYLGWTADEEWLLSRLWTVEVMQMTSWSLLTARFGIYNLVSFQFCFCLMLFEYDNKCESVCLFSNVLLCRLCAVGKQDRSWPLEKLSARVLLLRDLFGLLPNTSSYCPSQYFLGQKASGLEQPRGAATMLQTLDSGSHIMTCWSLWWDLPIHLGDFGYVTFLTVMDFPSLTLTDIFSFVLLFLFLSFYWYIPLFIVWLFFVWVYVCFNWLVKA